MDSLLHTIPEAQAQLGVGRSTIYALMASGVLHPVKIGSRTLIPHADLEAYVSRLRMVAAQTIEEGETA